MKFQPENNMSKVLIIVGILVVMGCQDEEQKERAQNRSLQVQTLAKELYITPPSPQVEVPLSPKKEEPIITPVEFPPPYPLIREQKAKEARGKRQEMARKNAILTKDKDKQKGLKFQDEDYRQWEPLLPEDKSTFPVDRSRILTADMRLSAILEDNINSQIPGRVIAIIDRNVLSPNGKFILFPAYTRVICTYTSLEENGETRLPLSCRRMIRPDGTSILLTNAIASDQMGRNGLIGEVDNKIFERYGAAFIIAGISALGQNHVQPSQMPLLNNANTVNVLSNNLGQVTTEVIKQNIDLRPIITIAAGSRIQLIPQTDIVLRKPLEVTP